jgi:hypothetical protein
MLCGIRHTPSGAIVSVPDDIQDAIDAVVTWAHGGPKRVKAWERVCRHAEDEELGIGDPAADMIQVYPAWALPRIGDLEEEMEDDDVRPWCALGPADKVSPLNRMRYYVGSILAARLGDGSETWEWRIPLAIVARDGREAVIPRTMAGNMMGNGYSQTFHPPARSWPEHIAHLRQDRWIFDTEEWLRLDEAEQRRYFRP